MGMDGKNLANHHNDFDNRSRMSTVQDVARIAGVSTASVSRVLNGYTHVSPKLTNKVNQAIDLLGFRPNFTAKSLRTSRTYRIVITVPDITNTFFSNIIRGAEETAQAQGYSVLLGDVGGNVVAQENYTSMIQRREADGLVFLGHSLPKSLEREIEGLREQAPIVNGCELQDGLRVSSVHIDNAQAASEVMDYLYHLGHNQIGIITGNLDSPISRDRLAGVHRSASLRGKIELLRIMTGDYSIESGAQLAHGLIRMQPRPTAIFCFSDDMALGALASVRTAGLTCPDEISIVGFDDIKSSRFLDPPLTTVAQPMREIGRKTVEVLLAIIEGKSRGLVNLTLPHELIIRGSAGPPHSSV